MFCNWERDKGRGSLFHNGLRNVVKSLVSKIDQQSIKRKNDTGCSLTSRFRMVTAETERCIEDELQLREILQNLQWQKPIGRHYFGEAPILRC